MFSPRRIATLPSSYDCDGIKIYTIAVSQAAVDPQFFSGRLQQVKLSRALDWRHTPAFCIFHEGAERRYLILAWWGNGNELFTSVSVELEQGWVEDPVQFSFCVYDLEIFWAERNFFIASIDCAAPDLHQYKIQRFAGDESPEIKK